MGTKLKTSIHNLGKRPFFVHYWSNSQLNVFDKYLRDSGAGRVCIDASGNFVKPVIRADGSKSEDIFLYTMVIDTGEDEFNQFPVAQMLSERHTSVAIFNWLAEFTRLSHLKMLPREVVCDSSRALMLGIVHQQ